MHVTWRLSIALPRLGHSWLLVHPLAEFFNCFCLVLFLVFKRSPSSQGWPQTWCVDENELLIARPPPPQGWIGVCHLTLSADSFFSSACVCSCVEVRCMYACHLTHVVVRGQTPASVGLTLCLASNRSLVFTAVYIRLAGPWAPQDPPTSASLALLRSAEITDMPYCAQLYTGSGGSKSGPFLWQAFYPLSYLSYFHRATN